MAAHLLFVTTMRPYPEETSGKRLARRGRGLGDWLAFIHPAAEKGVLGNWDSRIYHSRKLRRHSLRVWVGWYKRYCILPRKGSEPTENIQGFLHHLRALLLGRFQGVGRLVQTLRCSTRKGSEFSSENLVSSPSPSLLPVGPPRWFILCERRERSTLILEARRLLLVIRCSRRVSWSQSLLPLG